LDDLYNNLGLQDQNCLNHYNDNRRGVNLMTRDLFFNELREMNNTVISMGNLTIEAIDKSIQALVEQDKKIAKEVIEGDEAIDRLEELITAKGMHLLLTQQPVSSDFKEILAIIKMVIDMERIADQASDIAKLSINFNSPFLKKIEHIPMMNEIAQKMVRNALKAFVEKDQEMAIKTIQEDDILDDLYQIVRKELISLIPNSNESNSEQIADLLIIAKYLERIGDHATNICEWIIFSNTGVHKRSKLL